MSDRDWLKALIKPVECEPCQALSSRKRPLRCSSCAKLYLPVLRCSFFDFSPFHSPIFHAAILLLYLLRTVKEGFFSVGLPCFTSYSLQFLVRFNHFFTENFPLVHMETTTHAETSNYFYACIECSAIESQRIHEISALENLFLDLE